MIKKLLKFLSLIIAFSYLSLAQSSAIIVTVDGLDFTKILGRKIILDGLNIKLDELNCSFEDWDNYLGEVLKPVETENPNLIIKPFVWERSSAYTDYYIISLRDLLREQYESAKKNNHKLIVVAHSWGTFLAYAALSSKYNNVFDPVQCDLLITLGSPLGTEYANKNKIKDPFEYLVTKYINGWLDALHLKRADNRLNVLEWYNFWNWGDIISGPIKNRESMVIDEEVLPAFIPGGVNKLLRNIVSTSVWHKYNSLQPGGLINNTNLRNRIFDLIKSKLKEFKSDKIVLGFILDSSGSMAQNDPNDMRKSAVEMIINELNGDENVFLIDFDDQATWLNYNNHENYNKEMLKNNVRRVNSNGGTNIGSGLLELKRAIETAGIKSLKGGVILLTDGKNNSTFDFNTLVWYKNNNFPISTVSFVGDVDNKLLNDIATMTNGNYFRANNAYDVARYFREFINRVSGNSSLTLLRQIIQQGELQPFSFYVDRAMSFIYLGLNWDGSKIRLKLISPSNKIYNENDNNGEWNLGNNYSSVKILNPESGKWKAEFYGESIPPNGEEYFFQVIGDSPNRIRIVEKLLLSGQIQFSLNQDAHKNFTETKAKIEVLTPKNRIEDISKNFSGDGFNYRPSDGEGNYNFEIHLIGKDERGSIIQRYFTRTVLIGEASPSNIAPVKLIEGNYIYTELGKGIGNFPGLECMIYSKNGNTPIAKGFVTFVNETECTIEIQEFLSNQEVDIGDIVELDITQWQQDF